MIKYLTQRDIVELLKITMCQFRYYSKLVGIKPNIDNQRRYYYSIQDLITIYEVIFNPKRELILESKINYKQMSL